MWLEIGNMMIDKDYEFKTWHDMGSSRLNIFLPVSSAKSSVCSQELRTEVQWGAPHKNFRTEVQWGAPHAWGAVRCSEAHEVPPPLSIFSLLATL